MGLIEQAARRLEELRRAGFEATPADPPPAPPPAPTPPARPAAEMAARAERPLPPRAAAATPRAIHRTPRVKLDLAALAAQGFVTPDNPRSRTMSEMRVIKRPVLENASPDAPAPVRAGNLVMVTSSLPGEGKTFAAVNLAMSIAMEVDRTALLVDADVARPSLARVLGIPETRGLLDRLADPSLDLREILLPTNVDKLTILPSGRPNSRATEMLASEAMNQLVTELGRRYPDRVIIFDSPPLLLTTEARVLAQHMGQIVFVVAAGATQVADVQRALATIEPCPVKLMVLNKAPAGAVGEYGYGYGYGQPPGS